MDALGVNPGASLLAGGRLGRREQFEHFARESFRCESSGAGTMGLEGNALRLAELDRQVDQFLRERNAEGLRRALTKYADLRVSIQHGRLDEDVVSIKDQRARDVLIKISGGEGLQADGFIRAYGEITGDSSLAAFGELTDADVEELGLDLLYSWYSHHEYVRALADLRPLILEGDPARSVKRLVQEAKHCYAFQQYDATLARSSFIT